MHGLYDLIKKGEDGFELTTLWFQNLMLYLLSHHKCANCANWHNIACQIQLHQPMFVDF